jgi:hypothetical protein
VQVVFLEEWWWELHVGVFGGKVGGRRMLVCMCLPESQQINICNIDEWLTMGCGIIRDRRAGLLPASGSPGLKPSSWFSRSHYQLLDLLFSKPC